MQSANSVKRVRVRVNETRAGSGLDVTRTSVNINHMIRQTHLLVFDPAEEQPRVSERLVRVHHVPELARNEQLLTEVPGMSCAFDRL